MDSLSTQVFWTVANAGALTTRRLISQYGPKPNWQSLIEERWLREYHTGYGAVLALGPAARQGFREQPPTPQEGYVPYVAGPNAVADRAYLMDAVAVLEARGYKVAYHVYKRAGKVGGAARRGIKVTDQIVRTVVRAPEAKMRELEATYGKGKPPPLYFDGLRDEVLGHPSLYASISGGGIKLPQLRRLYKRHKSHLNRWNVPLLVAVPEEGDLGSFIRAVETKDRTITERLVKDRLIRERPIQPRIRLVIVPLPERRG